MLYIPHGSDETIEPIVAVCNSIGLYIPHGSDETAVASPAPPKFNDLYIPHGSDETKHAKIMKKPYEVFISHMVQMKLAISFHVKKVVQALYPTWFR